MKNFFTLFLIISLMGCAGSSDVWTAEGKGIKISLKDNEIYFRTIGVITNDGFKELKEFKTVFHDEDESFGKGEVYKIKGKTEAGEMEVDFYVVEKEKVFLRASFEPEGAMKFISFVFFLELLGWDKSSVYINGMQSWSPVYITSIKRGELDFELIKNFDEWYDLLISNPNLSWWFTGLRKEEVSFIAGAITFEKLKTRFFIYSKENGAEVVFLNGNIKEETDGKISSEVLYLSFEKDLFEGLERYMEEVKVFYPPLNGPFNPVGWNSWNTFFNRIKFEDVLQAMDFIKKELHHLGINNIQIDDGWEKMWGEWEEENPSFGASTSEFVSAVTSSGFIAGIWLAPFLAEEESGVFKSHPSWFIRDKNGNPLPYQFPPGGKRLYILDLTHPSALEWVLGIIKKLLDEGYRYLKLDFLFAGLIEGERLNKTITPLQAFRSAMESIKNLAEKYDAYILACGAPILPIAGLVHGVRIGGDIAFDGVPYSWSFVYNELRNLFLRLPLSNLMRVDPDTLLMRDITLDEAKTFLVGILISGGLFALGDNFLNLEKEKVQLLKTLKDLSLFPPAGENRFLSDEFSLVRQFVRIPLPVTGVYSSDDVLPSVWYFSDSSGRYITVFNWNEEEREMEVPTEDIFGISPDRFLELFTGERGNERMKIPPHGVIFLKGG